MKHPISLFIAAALGIAIIASVNFVTAPENTGFAAASMSGSGGAGTAESGGGGW